MDLTLVIGARGSVGGHVVDQLVAAGHPVRASARTATTDLPVPTIVADLTRPESFGPALDGVRNVFLYAPDHGAEAFAEVARAAGVEHVVVLSSGSVLLPHAAGNAIAEHHRTVEAQLSRSGPRCTPIRPLVLASNALNWASSIKSGGVVPLVHADGVTAPIHERDIAAVAVAALTGATEHVSGLLTGPEPLTQRRQVELIAEAIGTGVRIEELTPEQARAHFGRFADAETVEAILWFIADSAEGGSPATDTAQRVLGRSAVPFTRWAADHAADFRR